MNKDVYNNTNNQKKIDNNNNNNNNIHICIAPYGRNFRGAKRIKCTSSDN